MSPLQYSDYIPENIGHNIRINMIEGSVYGEPLSIPEVFLFSKLKVKKLFSSTRSKLALSSQCMFYVDHPRLT